MQGLYGRAAALRVRVTNMATRIQRGSPFLRAVAAGAACLVFGATLFFAASGALAATYVSKQTGNWNAGTTWARQRTGTITTNAASTNVTGAGTLFTTELAVGNQLFTQAGALIGTIASFVSATQLTLTANAASTNAGIPYFATTATTPVAADTVGINAPHTVTITAAAAAQSVTLTGPGGAANLTHNAGIALAVGAGGVTILSSFDTDSTKAWNINAGSATVAGNVTLTQGSASNLRIARINLTSGPAPNAVLTIQGNLVFTVANAARAVINMAGGTADGTINLGGAFTIVTTGTLTMGAGAAVFNYNGANAQTVPIGVSGVIYRNLHLNNSNAAGATLSAAISAANVSGNVRVQSGVLNNGGFAMVGGAGDTFEVANGARLNLTANSIVATGFATRTFGPTSTVSYGGGLQAVGAGVTYGHLILEGAAASTKFMGTAAAQTITVAGDFTVQGTSTTYDGATFNPAVNLAGNFTNNATTFNSGTGIYTFSGAAAQNIAGALASTFQNVTISKTAAANTVSVSAGTPSPTVNGTLTLTMGQLVTSGAACPAAQPIIVGATGTIAGGSANSYVRGTLRKNFNVGTLNFRAVAGADEFPVGTAASYFPIEITAGGTSTAGNLAVCVVATDHPQVTAPVSTTGIDAARSLNRYWSLTNTTLNTASGVGAALVNATFKFTGLPGPDPGYVDALAVPANFIVERWNGTIWSPTTLVAAAATSTQVQNIDLTAGANHIALGQPFAGFTALPGGFNAFDTTTTAGAVIGTIQTKVAATAFTVRLVRLNAARNAIDTTYNQAGVTVELLDSTDNTGAPPSAITACRAIGPGIGQWHQIAGTSQLVNFAAGIVNATFTIAMLPNVYRDVRVRIVKVGAGAGEGCSTDPFAIRPQSLTTSARDADWETAGTARLLDTTAATGGNVHKASTALAGTPRPFTLRVTPAPGGASNYAGNPTTVAAFPACIAPPAACATGTLSYTAGSWVAGAVAGTRENSTANYSEAGVFNLRLEDQTFADVDLPDGSSLATRTVPATASASIGRFVPERFEITAVTAPVFRTFNAADVSCSAAASPPKRSFTYIGQPFGYLTLPVATVTAKNAAGGTTLNYTGALWKLTNASVTQSLANSPVRPLDLTGVGAPALNETAGTGTGTYTANAADAIAFTRDNATPQAPFNADLSLTVSVSDASEAGGGQGTIATSPSFAFNTIAFDSVNLFRYGRLRMSNANGSQLVPLPVPIETQYFTGPPTNAFVTNAADHCTTLAATNITMGNFQVNLGPLASCKTNMNPAITFTNGRGNLQLSAPGSASNGSVDLIVQLATGPFGATSCQTPGSPPPQATTGANRLYLQGNWTGVAFDQNPTSRATFGVYKGAEEIIYFRENF